MIPFDLRVYAQEAHAKGHEYLILVLYRSTEPRGEYVRLLGRSGPRGRFVGAERMVSGGVKVIADFKAADVLAWLDKQAPVGPSAEAERRRPDA